MSQSAKSSASTDDQDLLALRKLLLGEQSQVITEALKANARDVVSEVFSEALHDREKQDGSVHKMIVPLVEKSVERSVSSHSEQMVGYLYPLVGSLVRKSVSAFFTDLLEKTNTLIENSFTIKGLKWRFKAWQAGVSFSQYVTTQTFNFRVEQVFLIHRQSGLLLHSLSRELPRSTDAALMSSMLTAINDFVTDSFMPDRANGEQQLDVVKTDDFTLIIKQGPQAVLVAAVSGIVPQKVTDQLQVSLEEIHRFYSTELSQFTGDAEVFNQCEPQLRDCLLAELKAVSAPGKRPWLAWALLSLLILALAWLFTLRWMAHNRLEHLRQIDQQPGILVTRAHLQGLRQLELGLLRDPSAITVADWLSQQGLQGEHLRVIEHPYLSLDPELLKVKVSGLVNRYSGLSLEWQDNQPLIRGNLTRMQKMRLQSELNKVPGLALTPATLETLDISDSSNNAADDPAIMRAVLEVNIAKLEQLSVSFEVGESSLSAAAISTLENLSLDFNQLVELAAQQHLSLGLVIMGASDPTGSESFNQVLSQKRADAVKNKLHQLGIEKNRLNAIGLGVIALKTSGDDARKVLFNVVYFDAG